MITDRVNQVKELKVQVGLQGYAVCTLKKEYQSFWITQRGKRFHKLMQVLHLKIQPAWQVLTEEEEQGKMGIPKNVKGTFIYTPHWLFPSISTTYLAVFLQC